MRRETVIIIAAIIPAIGVIIAAFISRPLPGPQPTPVSTMPPIAVPTTPGITPTQPPSTGTSLQSEDLGLLRSPHADGSYPQPPAANGAIVAHGDILNDGSCHIKIFYSGDTVANLGHGSFRLVRLTGGNRDTIHQYVKDTIQPQLGNCPII